MVASLAPETAAEMEDAFALQISIIATNVLKRVAEARRWNVRRLPVATAVAKQIVGCRDRDRCDKERRSRTTYFFTKGRSAGVERRTP
jgi:hypothetical protein